MSRYLRFTSAYVFALASTAGILLGGAWMWLGISVIYAVMITGDELLGDDYSEPAYRMPRLLNSLLYLAVPVLAFMCCAMAWMAADSDLAGLGAWAADRFGYDMLSGRSGSQPWHWLGGILSAGHSFAAVGTNIGHELTHRTNDRGAVAIGRWLLALTLDAEFSIEHVYGHHRRLATAEDPASARRGEHFYAFLIRSVSGQARSAARLEQGRLETLGFSRLGWRNRQIRGWAMSLAIAGAFYLAAGWAGTLVFLLAALTGRAVLEAVNYFEHYGLVRVTHEPIEPRHSWNSNKRLSNVVLFNVARHSDHHAQGDAQFWQLRSRRDAPTLPYGYLTCMLLVFLLPGWYRKRMTPLLLDWDRRYASASERQLAAAANRESGVRELVAAAERG